jgi:hypothetical protein
LVGSFLRLNETDLRIDLIVEADEFDLFAVQPSGGVELIREILETLPGLFAGHPSGARKGIDEANLDRVFRECRKDIKAYAQREADHP